MSGRVSRRERQRTLDRVHYHSGRVPEFVFDMLERLEGRPDGGNAPTAVAPAP